MGATHTAAQIEAAQAKAIADSRAPFIESMSVVTRVIIIRRRPKVELPSAWGYRRAAVILDIVTVDTVTRIGKPAGYIGDEPRRWAGSHVKNNHPTY